MSGLRAELASRKTPAERYKFCECRFQNCRPPVAKKDATVLTTRLLRNSFPHNITLCFVNKRSAFPECSVLKRIPVAPHTWFSECSECFRFQDNGSIKSLINAKLRLFFRKGYILRLTEESVYIYTPNRFGPPKPGVLFIGMVWGNFMRELAGVSGKERNMKYWRISYVSCFLSWLKISLLFSH